MILGLPGEIIITFYTSSKAVISKHQMYKLTHLIYTHLCIDKTYTHLCKSYATRLTLWENEIGNMEDGNSYQICGVRVREYKNKKFLSTSREGSTITEIKDIGPVEDACDEIEDEEHTHKTEYWENIRVCGVLQLDSYSGCIKCTAKVLPIPDESEFGQCTKCQMMQSLEEAAKQVTAQLFLKTPAGHLTLRAFGKTVVDIAQTHNVTQLSLLKAPPFNISYKDGIIQTVTRHIISTE